MEVIRYVYCIRHRYALDRHSQHVCGFCGFPSSSVVARQRHQLGRVAFVVISLGSPKSRGRAWTIGGHWRASDWDCSRSGSGLLVGAITVVIRARWYCTFAGPRRISCWLLDPSRCGSQCHSPRNDGFPAVIMGPATARVVVPSTLSEIFLGNVETRGCQTSSL